MDGESNNAAAAELDFEGLVDRFYRGLYQFALSLTRNETEAGDLTQQTFYLWATKGQQLRDASKVKSWLFTTLHREFLHSRRREERFPHQELSEVDHELPSVSPAVVNAVDGHTVMRALGRVEAVYRAPLSLFYIEDFSYQQIAETLEVPVGTVMSRLARGKTQLMQILAEPGPKPGGKIVPFPAATEKDQSG